MKWNIFTMSTWNVCSTLILLVLALLLRIRGILWAAAGVLLLGGLIFSLKCYRQCRPVLGAFLWTAVLCSILFVLGLYVPDIRLWQLLYI